MAAFFGFAAAAAGTGIVAADFGGGREAGTRLCGFGGGRLALAGWSGRRLDGGFGGIRWNMWNCGGFGARQGSWAGDRGLERGEEGGAMFGFTLLAFARFDNIGIEVGVGVDEGG